MSPDRLGGFKMSKKNWRLGEAKGLGETEWPGQSACSSIMRKSNGAARLIAKSPFAMCWTA